MTRPQFAPRYPPPDPAMIQAKRRAASLSVSEAAQICEVSPGSWQKWEEGKTRMPAPVWKLFNLLLRGPP